MFQRFHSDTLHYLCFWAHYKTLIEYSEVRWMWRGARSKHTNRKRKKIDQNHNKANKHSAQIFDCIAYEILMWWCYGRIARWWECQITSKWVKVKGKVKMIFTSLSFPVTKNRANWIHHSHRIDRKMLI